MEHILTLFENVVRQQWDKPALSNFHGEVFTYGRTAMEIAKLHLIYKGLGLEKGERISIAAGNSAQWATVFLATLSYHAVAVPILAEFTPENILTLANHSESQILFTDRANFRMMKNEMMGSIRAVVGIDDFSLLYAETDDVRVAFEQSDRMFAETYRNGLEPHMVHYETGSSDELVVINYTSGTTGTPKGIMIPARALNSNIAYALKYIPATPGSDIISMLPMGHMYGLAFEFLYPLMAGCHIHFLAKVPSPTILLTAFSEIRPYIFITVPLVVEKIIKNKVVPLLDKPVVRVLTHLPGVSNFIYAKIRRSFMNALGGNVCTIPIGGAALNPEVEKILLKAKIPISIGYGMTECAPLIGYEKDFSVKGSCGKVVDNMQVRIDSDNPHCVAGEIQVKGANVMLGYFKNEDATKAAFTDDGWMKTGDLGVIDRKGNIFIKGRSKFMILTSNGQNIYPEEIEAVINALPLVSESIVVERDRQLVAIVSLIDKPTQNEDTGKTADDIRRGVNAQLPGYSRLSKVEILKDDFVHTPKHSIKRNLYS
ncbi:MAG: AMP-binding protein [Bacteroidaceae bacterium]|nr:AMP-binding protein [Bacteroidaceae bacterium]